MNAIAQTLVRLAKVPEWAKGRKFPYKGDQLAFSTIERRDPAAARRIREQHRAGVVPAYHISPVRNSQELQQREKLHKLHPRSVLHTQGQYEDNLASNPEMVYFFGDMRSPPGHFGPEDVHLDSPLSVVFSPENIDETNLHPDEDSLPYVLPIEHEHFKKAIQRLRGRRHRGKGKDKQAKATKAEERRVRRPSTAQALDPKTRFRHQEENQHLWRDSLEAHNTVAHKGSVPVSVAGHILRREHYNHLKDKLHGEAQPVEEQHHGKRTRRRESSLVFLPHHPEHSAVFHSEILSGKADKEIKERKQQEREQRQAQQAKHQKHAKKLSKDLGIQLHFRRGEFTGDISQQVHPGGRVLSTSAHFTPNSARPYSISTEHLGKHGEIRSRSRRFKNRDSFVAAVRGMQE